MPLVSSARSSSVSTWATIPSVSRKPPYAVDSRDEVLRAADICLEKGVFIETGPSKHAIQQTFFLYIYEPGGNRFEVCNAGARLMLAPDWTPIVWTEAERKKGQAWGLQTIPSFHTHGTPPVE
jgi:catechol 2,3-dioxygenase